MTNSSLYFARKLSTPAKGSARLAFIAHQAESVGNFRGPLIRHLVLQGVKVFALAPDYTAESRSAVEAVGATPVDSSLARTGMNIFRDARDLFSLVRQLRSLELDATFAYAIKPVIYGTVAAKIANIPRRFALVEGAGHVFTDYGSSSLRRALLRCFVERLYRFGLSKAERVFFLNKDDRELFTRAKIVDPQKVKVLDGIGVDLERFTSTASVTSPITFLLIGRLLREKGVWDYIEAARRVKAVHSSSRFLLLGGVDLNPSSATAADVESWKAEGVLEVVPHCQDVGPWIAQASVFVLPSYREGLPRSTQEAMAMARPIITTDVPGCRETVIDGYNGFMVPVRDPVRLAEAMLRFVENPALVETMGRNSRSIAERRFDVRVVNSVIFETLNL